MQPDAAIPMHGETQVAGVAGTIACKQAMIVEAAVDRSQQSSPTVPPPNDHNRLPVVRPGADAAGCEHDAYR